MTAVPVPVLKINAHPTLDHHVVLTLLDGDMHAQLQLDHASAGFWNWPELSLMGAVEQLERTLGVQV